MTAMPQRTAISHAFGALAATLVGIAHYDYHHAHAGRRGRRASKWRRSGFEVLFGSLTITGSFMAFGKLQGCSPARRSRIKFQNESNIGLFIVAVLLFLYLVFSPADSAMHTVRVLSDGAGRAGRGRADRAADRRGRHAGGDLAAEFLRRAGLGATGFALDNNVLIIAGALDGACGFLLSILMSKAMNRSFANVLFGAFGGASRRRPAAASDRRA